MLEKLNASSIDSVERYDWDELVQEDRVHRLIYTDPAIFNLEMTNIFGAVWVYLGHESQIPANDDYITVRLGLRPIILLRDSHGKIRSYRGFIFATLNPDAPSLLDYLGPITKPIDEWLDRQPKGRIRVCEANRLKYKGNWKLAYDNSGDGYHVVFSHRSLMEMENRQADVANKGMSYYKNSPDTAPMYIAYMGNGHHFKDKRPNIERRAGGLWAVEGPAPGSEHYAEALRRRFGAKAEDILDLASSEPVNINVFPNFSLLGNHIQVFEPISVDETDVTWYGTAVVDEDGTLDGAVGDINALRMRTQEQFPNFGEVDDLANFEEIQRGLACREDEWIYMHRGLGIPGRVKTHANGIITAPATDEVFMREYIKEWKRLMKATPKLAAQREP
ncbi:MAG: aromatic ring-hydroxylating dioxygenase subunit alpha [Alphaproteobacteria bacterium]|nr:MAG: aromatic ring-hydroxylating dioxygenase subunit alpha [Alphaproteobacteria bacterium]